MPNSWPQAKNIKEEPLKVWVKKTRARAKNGSSILSLIQLKGGRPQLEPKACRPTEAKQSRGGAPRKLAMMQKGWIPHGHEGGVPPCENGFCPSRTKMRLVDQWSQRSLQLCARSYLGGCAGTQYRATQGNQRPCCTTIPPGGFPEMWERRHASHVTRPFGQIQGEP